MQIIDSAMGTLNSMLNSIDLKTQETIKRSFFLIIFIMSIIAMILGYNSGQDSAKIKSPPVAEYVNDTFKIDINQEKEKGDFSSILESKVMSESTVNNFKKYKFNIKEENPDSMANKIIQPKTMKERTDIIQRDENPIDPQIVPKIKTTEVQPLIRKPQEQEVILIREQQKEKPQVRDIKAKNLAEPQIYKKQDKIE